MKRLLISISLLAACCEHVEATEKEYPVKNAVCEKCILIAVIGHGVAEGRAGRYYLPQGYTVQRFWRERPVELSSPHTRFTITRKGDDGKDKVFSVDLRKDDSPPFVLQEGDVLFVTQPII